MTTALRTKAHNAYTSSKETISSEKLVVLLLERLIRDIDEATQAITDQRIETANTALTHGQDIITALSGALHEQSWEGVKPLGALYEFCNDQLIDANINKTVEPLLSVRPIAVEIYESFSAAHAVLLQEQEPNVA